jgi:hypothetical protein
MGWLQMVLSIYAGMSALASVLAIALCMAAARPVPEVRRSV